MRFLDWITKIFTNKDPNKPITASVSIILPSGYTKPPEQDCKVRKDMPLTPHFTLYQMTHTDRTELQSANRDLTDDQIKKLTLVAGLLESMREVVASPIIVHSAYRCPKLNASIGGVPTSQHQLCEAADWTPQGITAINDLYPIFKRVWNAAKHGKFAIGQLIFEEANNGTAWIHSSLGKPFRDPAKCGHILIMRDGNYELLDTVKNA